MRTAGIYDMATICVDRRKLGTPITPPNLLTNIHQRSQTRNTFSARLRKGCERGMPAPGGGHGFVRQSRRSKLNTTWYPLKDKLFQLGATMTKNWIGVRHSIYHFRFYNKSVHTYTNPHNAPEHLHIVATRGQQEANVSLIAGDQITRSSNMKQ